MWADARTLWVFLSRSLVCWRARGAKPELPVPPAQFFGVAVLCAMGFRWTSRAGTASEHRQVALCQARLAASSQVGAGEPRGCSNEGRLEVWSGHMKDAAAVAACGLLLSWSIWALEVATCGRPTLVSRDLSFALACVSWRDLRADESPSQVCELGGLSPSICEPAGEGESADLRSVVVAIQQGAGAAVLRRLAWSREERALHCYESVLAALEQRHGGESQVFSKVQVAIDRHLILTELHGRFGVAEIAWPGPDLFAETGRMTVRELERHAVLWKPRDCESSQPVTVFSRVVEEVEAVAIFGTTAGRGLSVAAETPSPIFEKSRRQPIADPASSATSSNAAARYLTYAHDVEPEVLECLGRIRDATRAVQFALALIRDPWQEGFVGPTARARVSDDGGSLDETCVATGRDNGGIPLCVLFVVRHHLCPPSYAEASFRIIDEEDETASNQECEAGTVTLSAQSSVTERFSGGPAPGCEVAGFVRRQLQGHFGASFAWGGSEAEAAVQDFVEFWCEADFSATLDPEKVAAAVAVQHLLRARRVKPCLSAARVDGTGEPAKFGGGLLSHALGGGLVGECSDTCSSVDSEVSASTSDGGSWSSVHSSRRRGGNRSDGLRNCRPAGVGAQQVSGHSGLCSRWVGDARPQPAATRKVFHGNPVSPAAV